MTIKQHIKGVFIAILSATVLLFTVSFFVGSEVRVNKSFVFKVNSDSLFNYLKEPKNFQKVIDGADGFKVTYLKDNGGVQYEGYDKKLHTFYYKAFDSAKGVEISYKREDEKLGLFKYKIKQQEEGCLLEFEKIWKVGSNPLAKVLSLGLDEDIEAGMKKEIKRIKKELN